MFADSLLDSALISRSHRGWTTLISFSVQALLVAALLMVPLLYTEGLPSLRLMQQAVIGPPPSRGPAPKIEPSQGRNPMLKNASGLVLMIPQQIPKGVAPRTDVLVGPPPELATGGSTSGPGGPGVPNGILSSTGDANVILIPPRPVHHPPSRTGQPHSSSAAGISAIGNSNPHARSGRDAGGHQPRRDNRKLAGGQRSSIAGAGRS